MKLKLTMTLLSSLILTACEQPESAQMPTKPTAKSYQSTLTEGMDTNVKPQQDFYRFVNGKWLTSAEIPSDRTSWGTLAELNELNEKRSLELLHKVMQNAQDPKAQRIKALYETYNNLEAREKAGLTGIQADLDRIAAIESVKDLEAFLIDEVKKGNDLLFGWSVFAELKNARQNGVYLSNEGLGLGKDYFQKDTPENRETLAKYQAYVADILSYAKLDNTAERAKAIIDYEKAIAKTMLTNEQARDIRKRDNPVAFADLAKISQNINLADFLTAVGVKTETVTLWEKGYFDAFDQLINAERLPVIKDYLRFKLISGLANYLNKELEDRYFAFYDQTLRGQKTQRSLEKRSLSLVNSWLGQEFGQFYVAEFFPEQAKKSLLEMAGYLVKAYHQRIDNLDWMSTDTKQKAKAKLDKFITEVGYPNKWRDYSGLTLKSTAEGGDILQNLRAVAKFGYEYSLSQVGKPVDINEWGMLPQVVNASYSPLMNRIVFPAGILQAPLFDVNADPAVNFGAIGAIIGHEITHGFDDSGSKFDGDGNLKEWWTAEDRQKFEALAEKLVTQFNQFEVAPNVFVNGKFTLGENIADLGGLSIAFDALKLYEQDHGISPELDGFNGDQRFFMSWTRSWRVKATVQSLTHQVKSDPHAPGEFRAYAPLLNINSFHRVFGTQAGDKMYRPDEERIKIW